MADGVSKSDVTAFRLDAHHLGERLGDGGLLDAAGRCGIQNSPPGSALLALHARVKDVTQERVADAVAEEKSLLQTWSMRGSPFYFPASDAAVFTTGVLPPTEKAMRHLVPGVEPSLEKLGMSLTETVELISAEIEDALSGRRLAVNELGAEIAQRIARGLPRGYGPSTRADFAAWLGIRTGDTDPWWSPVEDELTQVELDGTSWILTEDLDALRSPPTPKGVRLLPPRDPYTQLRDRETIVDKEHHRDVWKTVGEPGAVLARGKIAGTWRPRKSGRKLTITVTAFGTLPERDKKSLRNEAEQVAPLRGASTVDVEFDAV